MNEEQKLLTAARARFALFSPGPDIEVRVFFAPGRVNLIGEHTDYNGGYVFPAALRLGTWVFVRERLDGVLRFASTAFSEIVTAQVGELVYRADEGFANYPKGALWALEQLGARMRGGDFLFVGNLPHSAGLSSSASVELATTVAADALLDTRFDRITLIKASQRAENEFLGVNSGIMDQFAVAMGQVDRALLLHCGSLEYEAVPLVLDDVQFVVMNTCYKRGLADSKYNERFTECQEAVRILQEVRPGLQYLAELSKDEWPSVAPVIADLVIRRRAEHVVLENARTLEAAEVWKAGDAKSFGELMNASHCSLRDSYEVTGQALDALVDAAWRAPGCIGARMTGAGFGGCAVALVYRDQVPAFIAAVKDGYKELTGIDGEFYLGEIGAGAREVTEEVMSA